jgi:hypothetical protein
MIFGRCSFDAPSLINALLPEYFLSIPAKISNQLARTLFHFRFRLVASWLKGDLSRGALSMVANSGKPNIEDYKQHVRFGSKAEMLIASNVFRFAPNSEYDTPSLCPGIGCLITTAI